MARELVQLQRQAGNGAVCALLGVDGGGTPQLQRDVAHAPSASPACAARPPGEALQSRAVGGILGIDAVFIESDRTLTISDFPIGTPVMPAGVVSSPVWERLMSTIIGDRTVRLVIEGYTDCVGAGAEQENLGLRQQRADALVAALPEKARGRVFLSVAANPSAYLETNTTPEGRAGNRAAKLTFGSDNPSKDPGDVVPKAKSLDEYLYLVRGLERKLNLTTPADAPEALSVLRQLYYGSSSWSKHVEKHWDRVITGRPWAPGADPTPRLGPSLAKALKESQEVEGIDIAHTLTGLDAMMKPGTVDIPGPLSSTVMNEALASWSGDVGWAASHWALDQVFLTKEGDARFHFTSWASDADLQGDVDAFAIRAGFNAGQPPPSQVGLSLNLQGPLSQALLNYYRTTNTSMGAARQRRIQTFIEAFGGKIRTGQLQNRPELEAALRPQIRESAYKRNQYELIFNARINSLPPGAPDPYPVTENACTVMTQFFVDWLETKLHQELSA
ncbi:MAG: hypothetical protein E6J00_13140 [Chloroflexi bacterium]|nr:MAG: hypothetical protein E6J00_13140 [Chloroflexota bacterium]